MNRDSSTEPWEELYRYWLSKHLGERPPSRAEIDPPADIPRLVANLMILDIIPGGYRYRLFGSAIAYRFGMDMTGQIFGSSETNAETMNQCRIAFDGVITHQKPQMLIGGTAGADTPRNVLLALPLVLPNGQIDRILAGSFFDRYVKPGMPILGMMPMEVPRAPPSKS
jgi:hypothetical protein